MKIEVVESPNQELMNFFEQRIAEFNIVRWEIKEKIPLVIRVTNDHEEIIAGVSSKTFGNWLLIENLWVAEALRGQNMGTKILKALESAAIQRGCKFALLDTLGFQARPFYEKHGYTVQWTQQKYPKEGLKYFMVKEF